MPTNRPDDAAPKWIAVVDDRPVPMPRRQLKARDILVQSGVAPGSLLVRDFESPNDVGFDSDAVVDLGDGNVFRTSSDCQISHEVRYHAPPKLAFSLDDKWEVTIQPHQTGESLRGLFGICEDLELLRDFESPNDEPVDDDERLEFVDGPVFVTAEPRFTIIVNGQPKQVAKRRLSYHELVVLAYGSDDTGPQIEYSITYDRGPRANPDGTVVVGRSVKIRNGMLFNVQRTDKS